MRRVWSVLAGLALLGSPRTESPPVIASAYPEGGDLLFDSPIELNWDSLLPPSLQPRALAEDRARRRLLFEKRSDFGFTEVPFPVALPSVLLNRFYYLLDSAGIREIRPTGLKGTVRIEWAGDSATVGPMRVYGSVRARVVSDGGFVLSTEQRTTLKLEPSAFSADMLLAPDGGDYFGKGTPFRQITHQFEARETAPEPNRWIWVRWLSDTALVEAGCTYRFSLFHLTPKPALVASNDYGCDV
jgi:hypothetical protein